MISFHPADQNLFHSRADKDDPRLGDLVQSTGTEGVAIVGYTDDEGVRLNGGRPGAAAGPDEIRRCLFRMTPHLRRPLRAIVDLGNLSLEGPLGDRHDRAASEIGRLLERGLRVLTLGGGNDWAYADGIAFLKRYAADRPVIINVDAHLDVRDLSRGLTSGTPFFRLLESPYGFDFVEFGIQSQCNAKAHWQYAESKGARIVALDDLLGSPIPPLEFARGELGDWMLEKRPCFLAIDLDAFAPPWSIGTSAPTSLGLLPHDYWPLHLAWLRQLDVRVMGLYEVSPIHDPQSVTARWAAQLAHGFLHDV